MKGLNKATKAAMKLKKQIQSPVNDMYSSISQIFVEHIITSFPRIKGSPCDVIEIRGI